MTWSVSGRSSHRSRLHALTSAQTPYFVSCASSSLCLLNGYRRNMFLTHKVPPLMGTSNLNSNNNNHRPSFTMVNEPPSLPVEALLTSNSPLISSLRHPHAGWSNAEATAAYMRCSSTANSPPITMPNVYSMHSATAANSRNAVSLPRQDPTVALYHSSWHSASPTPTATTPTNATTAEGQQQQLQRHHQHHQHHHIHYPIRRSLSPVPVTVARGSSCLPFGSANDVFSTPNPSSVSATPSLISTGPGETTRSDQIHRLESLKASQHPNKIFVGGLPMGCSAADVFWLFETEVGPVHHVQLILAPIECGLDGQVIEASVVRHRGYGFVVFSDMIQKERALMRSNYYIGDKFIEVKEMTRFAKPRSDITPTTLVYKLFVALKSDAPEDRKSIIQLNESVLKTYFERFGKVGAVSVAKDNATGRFKSYGFISFLESEGPIQALAHGREHQIHADDQLYKVECKAYRPCKRRNQTDLSQQQPSAPTLSSQSSSLASQYPPGSSPNTSWDGPAAAAILGGGGGGNYAHSPMMSSVEDCAAISAAHHPHLGYRDQSGQSTLILPTEAWVRSPGAVLV